MMQAPPQQPMGQGMTPMPDQPVMPPDTVDPIDPTSGINHGITKGYDEKNLARIALCKKWAGKVQNAKKFFEKKFDRMHDDMNFISGHQWPTREQSKDNYTANITQKYVGSRVAALYAKNPTVVVSRRETIDFEIWDESKAELQQLQSVMTQMQSGMVPQTPQQFQIAQQASALYADIEQGIAQRKMLDKIARTMEVMFKYTLDQQTPTFKLGMKQLVRRACVTGVGYIKLSYKRILTKTPDDVQRVSDITQRIEEIKRLTYEMQEAGEDTTGISAENEQLRLDLEAVKNSKGLVLEDGVVFDFPKATSIIVDPKCTNLRTFWGAEWVAQEFLLTKEDIMEIYQRDVGDDFTEYVPDKKVFPNEGTQGEDRKETTQSCVWYIYDKTSGLVFVVCDGFPDFLMEPAPPDITIKRFWPFFPIVFNEVEDEKNIYPQSDVSLLRPMQEEYNRSRQGLREQRHANRPKMVYADGALDPTDVDKLKDHEANSCIPLKNLQIGQKVTDLIQPFEGTKIEPAMYETDSIFKDIQNVAGSPDSQAGGPGDGTATEASIAESSRVSSLQSNIDDLDDTFNELVVSTGQVLLKETDIQTIKEICGRGAIWPQYTAQQITDQLDFKIEAGSSGRPNSALEISNFEKLAPILLQIPGVSPDWMAKTAVKCLNANIDITEVLTGAMQSIIAMNSQQQVSTGNNATDPNQQGGQGGKPGMKPNHVMGAHSSNPNTPPPEQPNGIPSAQHPPHPSGPPPIPGSPGAIPPHPNASTIPQQPQ